MLHRRHGCDGDVPEVLLVANAFGLIQMKHAFIDGRAASRCRRGFGRAWRRADLWRGLLVQGAFTRGSRVAACAQQARQRCVLADGGVLDIASTPSSTDA